MARLEYSRCLICSIRGRCCYFSILMDDKEHNLILTNHPCTYLNVATGLCKVYKDRKEYFKDCMSIDEAKQKGALPVGCLYLKKGEVYPLPLKVMPPDDLKYYYRAIYDNENKRPHNEIQKLEEITT